MKILKISDDLHARLKEHLKDTKVFIQSYVEHIVGHAIDKNIIYMMKEKLKEISNILHIEESKERKFKRPVVKIALTQKKNYQYFKLIPKDIESFNSYFDALVQFSSSNEIYFNLPKYHNVTNPIIKPLDLEGSIKFLNRSKIDNFPLFELLGNVEEDVQDLLNSPIDGNFQLSCHCKIKDSTFDECSLYVDINIFNPEFTSEIGLKADLEKIELDKIEEYNIDYFKTDFLSFIQRNSKNCEKLSYIDNSLGHKKALSKILAISNIIATKSRLGPATHCIIPAWMINAFSEYTVNNEIGKLSLVGSMAGITFLASNLIDDIYLYKTGEQSLKLIYSFEDCDVNEICQKLVVDGDELIQKIEVLRQYDSTLINKGLTEYLASLKFLNIDSNYSPFSLTSHKFIVNGYDPIPSFGLDINDLIEIKIKDEISRTVVSACLDLKDSKHIELKFFGNEDFLTKQKMLDDSLEKCSNNAETPIVVNSLISTVLCDFAEMKMIEDRLILDPISIRLIGHYKNRPVYLDPCMKFNDLRILVLNDVQLKYAKEGLVVSAFKNGQNHEADYAYKVLNDICVIDIIDNEKSLL